MTTYLDLSTCIGRRVEIPVYFDLWMRGARFGIIKSYARGKPGEDDFIRVRMDHPRVKRLVKIPRGDWAFTRLCL